jgi:hypothetical protein
MWEKAGIRLCVEVKNLPEVALRSGTMPERRVSLPGVEMMHRTTKLDKRFAAQAARWFASRRRTDGPYLRPRAGIQTSLHSASFVFFVRECTAAERAATGFVFGLRLRWLGERPWTQRDDAFRDAQRLNSAAAGGGPLE